MSVPNIKLADGKSIPQLGLGVWKITDETQFETAFKAALETGYRHFDTAQAYGNEQFLGKLWPQSGLARKDLFITTKIMVQHFGYSKSKTSFAESLEKLQTKYVDLLLLHFPVPILRKKTWQAVEEIQAEGGAKSIGVSNYTIRHLEEMKKYAKVIPAINQVELHTYLQQPELVKYCQDNNIIIEAYSPLAHGHSMDNAVITEIAKKHHKTYAQIMIRFLIEHDFVVIPKSANPERVKENFDVFDFQLDKEDMEKLKKEDQNKRFLWSPVHVP